MEIVKAQLAETLEGAKKGETLTKEEPKGVDQGGGISLQKLQASPLREYSRTRESLVLNRWIWDMEGCLEQCCVRPRARVNVVGWYLKDNAYNWFLLAERCPFQS